MRLSILAVVLASVSAAAALKPGEPLPKLRGEFLTGRPADLPQDSAGRITLLALGFTYKSRFAVEAWVKRFRDDYGKHPGITFYEIPMVGGLARMGRWFIDSGMRRGTPKADHEHVITVYGGTEAWKRAVGFEAPEAAYLVLLDSRGNVRWQYGGGYDESAYKTLSAEVTRLLSQQASPMP